jgi:uncharacterized protein
MARQTQTKKTKATAGTLTVREAGRMGGEKVAAERGHSFYEEIGRKGGAKGGRRVRELIEQGKRLERR